MGSKYILHVSGSEVNGMFFGDSLTEIAEEINLVRKSVQPESTLAFNVEREGQPISRSQHRALVKAVGKDAGARLLPIAKPAPGEAEAN